MKAPLPANEDSRLAALQSYRVLGTRSAVLDDLTRLAASLCGTPTAAVSLSDVDRQWYAGRVGLVSEEVPRETAFCAHVVAEGAPLVVPDATADPRFAHLPAVRSGDTRFYAGVPLTDDDGHVLGTLFVLDQRPREAGTVRLDVLAVLARLAVDHLALHRSRLAATELGARLDLTSQREAEFLACLSHEVRTPVAIMRGYLEMLADVAAEGPAADLVEPIGRSVDRLVQLIDHLRFAADGADGAALMVTRVNLAGVVTAAVAGHRAAAERGGIDLVLTTPESVLVQGDPAQLARLTDNLVGNAVAFTRAGGRVGVRLIAGREPTLEVADTGVGIPAAERPHVFDRYFRGRYAREQAVGGVGLGLSIVRTVTHAHGGSVTLESTPDVGTTVRVVLPSPEKT
jgi:signal transduction histidine kinase